MNRLHWCAWIVAAMLCTVAPAAGDGPELIVNGGFEVGPQVGFGHHRLDPGSQAVQGWTVIRGSVDYAGEDWISPGGKHCLDIEGEASFGGVAQTIATLPGQVYTIRFDLAGNTDGDPQIKKMRVQAAGQSTERWFDIDDDTHHNLGWQTHTWQFLATSDTAKVEFFSVGDGPGHRGALIDNVSVTAAQPWGVRKRVVGPEAAPPCPGALSMQGDLRTDAPIAVNLNAGAGDRADVVQINSVRFALDQGWLQARVCGKLLSGPKGRWRVVIELLDKANTVVRRGDTTFENSGIIIGVAMIEDLSLMVDLGPWEGKPRPVVFRLSIENAPIARYYRGMKGEIRL